MVQFELRLNDGQALPTSLRQSHDNLRAAQKAAKSILLDAPDLRKIDVLCCGEHVASLGPMWNSRSCLDLSQCGERCPKYLRKLKSAGRAHLKLETAA